MLTNKCRLPDASVTSAGITEDVAALGQIGAGGTEFLNWFGSPTGNPPSNWTIYGYGTPEYVRVLKAAMKAHLDNGLTFDYAMSNNGAVPAAYNNPGLAWALKSSNITIKNGNYTGKLPGWGSGEFLAAQTYAVLSLESVLDDVASPWGPPKRYPQYTISNASVMDISSLVTSNGTITVTADEVKNAHSYVLQSWYMYQPLGREIIAASNPSSYLYNGSLYVDHFSATGAKVITDFLQKHVLVDGAKELLQEVGHYLWEDSVEIPATTFWTPGLEEIFEREHGVSSIRALAKTASDYSKYTIIPYLPLLQSVAGYQADQPVVSVRTDTIDGGAGVVDDFLSTLTGRLQSYYEYIVDWTHSLGLEFSGQMGYNLPVDMLQVVPVADAPECETLSFQNQIDPFLQFSGPADLSGKQIISIELGADYRTPFSQTWKRLLNDAKHSFVGGVNQVVIHGADYTHNFTQTTWPGYTTHNYDYPEHSRRQPGWQVGHPQALGYLSRVQWVLQSGTPKLDLAFWDKQTPQAGYPFPLYRPLDLVNAGYTYEYLSPENFALENAYVSGGLLAPIRQAFKALVVRGNDTFTPDGVHHLVKYAKAGLPIIVSGPMDSKYATAKKAEIESANESFKNLLNYGNVHQVPYENLTRNIAALGIQPRSRIQSNGTWYTRWRQLSNGDVYVFLYNDGDYSNGTVSFHNSGTPYSLNAWTGEETPIVEYVRSGGCTTISLELQNEETRIIKFTNLEALKVHALSSAAAVLGYKASKDSLQAQVTASKSSTVSLSSGKMVRIGRVCAGPTRKLTSWNLTIEQWGPPDDFFNLEISSKKVNITANHPEGSLQSWYNLGLTNVSGIGYYTANFSWSSSKCNSRDTGAYLFLPSVDHGIAGFLNGKPLPNFDITNPRLDISSYLAPGTNSLVLKVSSTLWNGIIPYWGKIRTAGGGPASALSVLPAVQHYGIIGEVTIVPYELVRLV
ncbi:hypothetical protein N7510_007454 [Penicillium lagena]|uniref:uncharacterized protein n=1 Tax=Penicillium lagena TaxID=94218 RepID=UPI0025422067|nr:uncharacterized protein N7510_007454 [Penicillium lagena]KAJ5610735.1 hypothetical protein N7510_007454 [Penicillium lagena]